MTDLSGKVLINSLSGVVGEKNLNGCVAVHGISGRICPIRLYGGLFSKKMEGVIQFAVAKAGNGRAYRFVLSIPAIPRITNAVKIVENISAGVSAIKTEGV